MTIDIEVALLRAVAPAHLADAIIGDLYERRARGAQTADVLYSIPPLLAHRISQAFAHNWLFALCAAAVTDAVCVATIPFWDHLGLSGGAFHVLRLAIIGLVLGCIPRASTLSCALLLALIAISNCAIDAREANGIGRVVTDWRYYNGLMVDGAAMAVALMALQIPLRRK